MLERTEVSRSSQFNYDRHISDFLLTAARYFELDSASLSNHDPQDRVELACTPV
jgi:hypothetical protein